MRLQHSWQSRRQAKPFPLSACTRGKPTGAPRAAKPPAARSVTKRNFTSHSLVKALDAHKARLGLPRSQKSLVIIDVWSKSAHRLRSRRMYRRRTAHAWLVTTLLKQRSEGKSLDLNTKVGVLRDASVGWIWEGHKVIQNKERSFSPGQCVPSAAVSICRSSA